MSGFLWSVEQLETVFEAVHYDLKKRYASVDVETFKQEVLKTIGEKKE